MAAYLHQKHIILVVKRGDNGEREGGGGRDIAAYLHQKHILLLMGEVGGWRGGGAWTEVDE